MVWDANNFIKAHLEFFSALNTGYKFTTYGEFNIVIYRIVNLILYLSLAE